MDRKKDLYIVVISNQSGFDTVNNIFCLIAENEDHALGQALNEQKQCYGDLTIKEYNVERVDKEYLAAAARQCLHVPDSVNLLEEEN